MKREIKFRVYTKDTWMDGTNGTDMLYDYQDTIYVESFGFKDIPVMQFTGLKDKNGVDIYEGDILKCDNEMIKIYYSGCSFEGSFIKNKNLLLPIRNNNYYQWEVIGNIYENEELLNK